MNTIKRAVFEACLAKGGIVRVHVLPAEGLKLPRSVTLPTVLEYGLNLAKPIVDLDVQEGGIRATLSFGNAPEETFVPWDSVLAAVILDPCLFIAQWPRGCEPPRAGKPRLGLVS